MFEKILLPLDGSELSEITIPYGEELAYKFGSELILYHARGQGNEELEHVHQTYLDRLAETIKQNITKSGSKGVKVTIKVQAGGSAQNICNFVSDNKIDLIIMSAVSASGLKIGKMLGSVTDHVCHIVPIPVMLIRPNNVPRANKKEKLINNILIPLDGSDLSKLALPIGEKLSTKLKVPITIFEMAEMIRPYNTWAGYGPIVDYTQLDEAAKKQTNEEMAALNMELKQKGVDVTNVVTSGFDAAIEIEKLCKKRGIDLVIMSTHGRSGLSRWMIGSVAEKVLRYGEVPLLLINARAT